MSTQIGIAHAQPVRESHAQRVTVLDDGALVARSCGIVYTPAVLGALWYGYRVVATAAFRRTLRQRRKAAKQRGEQVPATEIEE